MAAGWITALKLIPWDDVVANAPAVLRGAKEQEVARLREQADTAAGVRTRILMVACGVLAAALVAVVLIR